VAYTELRSALESAVTGAVFDLLAIPQYRESAKVLISMRGFAYGGKEALSFKELIEYLEEKYGEKRVERSSEILEAIDTGLKDFNPKFSFIGLLKQLESWKIIDSETHEFIKGVYAALSEYVHRVRPLSTETAMRLLFNKDLFPLEPIPARASIFYSGDLRFEPISSISSRLDEIVRILNLDGVDVAVLEGTNFNTEHALVTASMFREYISLLLQEYELVSVSIDPLDLETFTALLDSSRLMERCLVIGSERLLWVVDELERLRPKALGKMCVSEELEVPVQLSLKSISLVDEVFKNLKDYVLVVEPIGLLRILRKLKMWGEVPSLAGSVVILMDPEPRESIKEVEEAALRVWLRTFGVQTLRLRLSGTTCRISSAV
jgi:hypothetical protein